MSLRPPVSGRTRTAVATAACLAFAALVFVPDVLAIQPPQENQEKQEKKKPLLLTTGFTSPVLDVTPSLSTFSGETLADIGQAEKASANQTSVKGLQRLMSVSSSEWEVRWDDRSDRPHLVQGAGLALLPGAGNRLRAEEAGLADAKGAEHKPDMADVERLLRGFVTDYADLLRIDNAALRLDPNRSVSVGNGRSWFVEFQQVYKGVPVEGANVFFRINNGNVVQFGADRVSDIAALSVKPSITNDAALSRVLRQLGMARSSVSEIVDAGTLKIYPTLTSGEAAAQAYQGTRGEGYGHVLAWEITFRRTGEVSTYKAVVNAHTGTLLQITDLTVFAAATVTGGIYPVTNSDAEVVRALPFANVTNGTTKVTSAAGVYDYSGGTATSTLNGRYIKIADSCGSISLSSTTTGNLAFGTSGGTNCTTPGVGGAGNTHAARSGFYHLTNINRKAASFLPNNSWLNGTLTANMNINQTCNAFWNGSTVNFYRSGGGCSNTGEIAAVFLHEWGHGMDTNSGGAASDQGTGEAVGDTFAFLETRDSCIGQNFLPGQNCPNCTGCTGVRDVGDFDISGPATIAKPSTVASNTGINCDQWACPYLAQGISPYQGPMGYEGHCESYIASSANWDLAQMLIANNGTEAGWAAMDQIWYESLTPSKSAYQVASGGKCNPSAVVNGCGATNWYTVYLAVDDDDGNLANGTPNGCRIWDAFNAHGIACGTRPACSIGCSPTAAADAGPDKTIGSGGSTTIGTAALANTTYSWSPGGQTTAVITVSPATTTTYTVTATTPCGTASDSVTVTVTVADTQAPTTSITAPANGATVSGTTTVTASASDNVGVTRVEFYVDGTLASTDITSPYSFAWDTSGLLPGSSHTLASKAYDAATNVGSSANVSVTIGSAFTAVYDSVLKAPKCATGGVSCDSGATLLNGRDGKGPEPNQPNTVNSSCADATTGVYHSDESNDRLKVSTVDGTALTVGKQVRIDATVWAYSSFTTDKLDLYFAADASSPSWTFVGTITPTRAGAQTLSATYTLPAGKLQAVRAQFRYQGSAGTCSTGGYNDRDDLAFGVAP